MKYGYSTRLTALLVVGMLNAPIATSAEVDFKQAYGDYQAAVTTNDVASMVLHAEQAFKLGTVKFGEHSIDASNLGLNWANALLAEAKQHSQKQANKAKALSLFLNAIPVYEAEFGNEAIELIDLLLGASEAEIDAKSAKKLLERAIEIAEDDSNPNLLALVKACAFNRLSPTEVYSRTIRNYAIDALDIYRETLPADSIDRLNVTASVAGIYFAENKNHRAIALYEELVTQYSVLSFDHPYKLVAHSRLVELYERESDSEKSTAHCIAIGSMKPWADAQEQQPIYRVNPEYPSSYLKNRKEGWVVMEFTVSESGFVSKPVILNSHGGQQFEKTSLAALKDWRYAPKFVDGKAVAAKSQVRLDYSIN
ncbi:energy transducer TonB [Shewanella sp. SR44-3]|uniref:energy transducer TonB n=1 Tax=Shewanella sp. SR44-3 TaxID=2760936 RepID=UPI00217603E1|nr:energy transducer TonB [Shewanella sp. SR44-3]